jgi:hypothetical protein
MISGIWRILVALPYPPQNLESNVSFSIFGHRYQSPFTEMLTNAENNKMR